MKQKTDNRKKKINETESWFKLTNSARLAKKNAENSK